MADTRNPDPTTLSQRGLIDVYPSAIEGVVQTGVARRDPAIVINRIDSLAKMFVSVELGARLFASSPGVAFFDLRLLPYPMGEK
ncbi:hypothetical protein [Thiocystis violacea]|uniref:hypothetical protein n=1 Tax=Thiocystis violacea TaxID=13725 RepID=UPI001907C3BF|nr:hypothetical protein [Thiocystis violacea]MBK1717287.1 hypothetical protein [Thiocystis violacea]